ncbi:glutathione S-transferase omega-1-like [Pomacea canaliculata]|uniref:glutathione S-transferase omega-1-like n=1 Tax=Pomacea canaliculata TaxID=400727 RepID=UPI000D72DC3B|nr:glutathione S-transferase omega-1-like [Pomacea canaliculata]
MSVYLRASRRLQSGYFALAVFTNFAQSLIKATDRNSRRDLFEETSVMSQKTLSAGSSCPPLSPGTLRLYSMRFCPYALRTRLVLAHKQIPFETVNVDLKNKPEWFLKINPKGLVPTLEKDGKVVYESLITCDYLDDVYPQNRLTPSDPYQRALDAMFLDYFSNKFVPNFYKVLRSKGKDDEARHELLKALQKINDEISKRGKFFGGDEVRMIDYMMWPWLQRLPFVRQFDPVFKASSSDLPELSAWSERMQALPAVQETDIKLEIYATFFKQSLEGNPPYDLGLEP